MSNPVIHSQHCASLCGISNAFSSTCMSDGLVLIADDSIMSAGFCISKCRRRNFPYAGLYGTQCYCLEEKHVLNNMTLFESGICNVPCPGNLREHCGGPSELSVYNISQMSPVTCELCPTTDTASGSDSSAECLGGFSAPTGKLWPQALQ